MKVYVFDMKKGRVRLGLSAALLALLVLLSFGVNLMVAVYRRGIFADANAPVSEGKLIIIDAGHGGEDCGAIGKNGVYEKDLNLAIALEIGRILEEKGYMTVYTRTDDRLLYKEEENIHGIRKISDLKNRCKIADKYPEAMFVSIHMNSFGKEKYSGLQVYYSEENEDSRGCAVLIQNTVREKLQPENDRAVKPGEGIYVLENIKNPAILIECGFLSNIAECEKLSKKEYQKELSFAIVCGIIEYIDEK